MTVLQVSRSMYGSRVSIHGLVRNLKFTMVRETLSKPDATPKPGFHDDALSAVREFRHRRWASRRSSRPTISETITGPLSKSADQADQLDWAWMTSRFLLTDDDWMKECGDDLANDPGHFQKERVNA